MINKEYVLHTEAAGFILNPISGNEEHCTIPAGTILKVIDYGAPIILVGNHKYKTAFIKLNFDYYLTPLLTYNQMWRDLNI